jgi:hypothetical protein
MIDPVYYTSSRIPNPESRVPNPESEPRIPNPESRIDHSTPNASRTFPGLPIRLTYPELT